MFRFHGRTLKLLGIGPAVSPCAVRALDAVEARTGRKLPASVREWYSLDGACSLLRRYSNDDPPLDIAEFGRPRKDSHGGGPHDLLARGLIVFRYENQAVCVWAFRIDAGDDPPVEVDVDSQFRVWTRCAPTFSDHLYAWMWDYGLVLTKDLLIQAQNRPLTDATIQYLEANGDIVDSGPNEELQQTGPERRRFPI